MIISTNNCLLHFFLFVVQMLNFIVANCREKCERSSGSFYQKGFKHHAMLGHSFKNFTVKKPFDCHVKCFDEKCRCQAYQMKGDHCELLDEDMYSAPEDLFKCNGYVYFGMNREYADQVRHVCLGSQLLNV